MHLSPSCAATDPEGRCSPALEPTNQWYAIAKISGLMLSKRIGSSGCIFISAMPTNLYGPETASIPSVACSPRPAVPVSSRRGIREPHVTVWGTGTPRREFLHVDDCADALVFLVENYSQADTINIGAGSDMPISNWRSGPVAETVGYQGESA